MYLKPVRCLCIIICFVGVRSQRGWGSSGYNTGFSNSWTPNGFSNQNFGNWNSNRPNQAVFGGDRYNTPYGINTNRRPIEQQSPYGSLDNSKTDTPKKSDISENAYNARKPVESSASIVDANTNVLSSLGSENLSPWGQVSGLNDQDSKTNGWNSNIIKSNTESNSLNNDNFSAFGSGKPSRTSGQNSKDFSNDNEAFDNGSDYKKNSVYSWNLNNKEQNKPNKKKWETNPGKSTNKPASSWNQFGNEKNQEESNNQSDKKTPVDSSILDELDKNDWYFGKESNYPKPPFKSVLNVDVSELWNFDKNRKSGKGSNNNRRRNRQTGAIKCECVSVDLCDEEDMIVGQEDVKNEWRPLEAFRCERLTEVCCTNPKSRFSGRAIVVENNDGRLRCGQRRIEKNSYGTFGENIGEPGEFPWILQLQNSEINCSASLIHPQLALTAAHCATNVPPEELSLKTGEWNSDYEPPQMRNVKRVIPHPAYSSRNPRNDIALLVMEDGFDLNDDVSPICLPVTNDKWDSERCLVAGWKTEEINGEIVRVLEKGGVDFIPQAECQNIMLVTDLWRNYVLHDSFVCARGKAESNACLENEGGPVMCPRQKQPDTYIQIGLVSKGMNCDNFGRPGIFTNVLKFLDWINKNHFDLGLNYDLDVRSF